MKGITLARLALALVLAGAFALAGCGGDDNGVDQSVHDQVVIDRDQAQQDLMDAEAERDQAQQDLMDAQDADAMQQAMADSEAAKALLAALQADLSAEPNAPSTTISVSSDGMLEVKATAYTMSEDMPDMIEGWRGAMLTNAGGDTIVVYTDIGDDGTQSLFDRYESTRPTDTTPRTYDIGGTNEIPWAAVMRPDEETTVGGTFATPALMFMGSAHGITGTFSCTGGDCAAPERYSDNTVGTAGGAWSFVPDEGAVSYLDDSTYLTFGWWLDKDAGGNPANFRLISPAAQGLTARTAGDTGGSALRGEATYKGGAAGKYAMASSTADTYEGGHFTAMATLTADFDADADPGTPVNDRNGIALGGMIDNFMTGDTARPDWSVKLMVDGNSTTADVAEPLGDLDIAATGVGATTEWSTGVAAKGMGTWTATFHGGDATGSETAPAAVTGTFNAAIGSAAQIQGAFGANKE